MKGKDGTIADCRILVGVQQIMCILVSSIYFNSFVFSLGAWILGLQQVYVSFKRVFLEREDDYKHCKMDIGFYQALHSKCSVLYSVA